MLTLWAHSFSELFASRTAATIEKKKKKCIYFLYFLLSTRTFLPDCSLLLVFRLHITVRNLGIDITDNAGTIKLQRGEHQASWTFRSALRFETGTALRTYHPESAVRRAGMAGTPLYIASVLVKKKTIQLLVWFMVWCVVVSFNLGWKKIIQAWWCVERGGSTERMFKTQTITSPNHLGEIDVRGRGHERPFSPKFSGQN